jgi:GT2 family glycosyltransferase
MTAVEAFESVFAFNIEKYVTLKGFAITGNLFCQRRVFDSVGLFGVGISEDVDWCHRAAAAGFSVGFAARANVKHPARRSWLDLRKKWLRVDSETYALKVHNKKSHIMWGLFGLALPVSAIAHTPRVLMSTQLNLVQKLAALGILYKLRVWRARDYWRLLFGMRRE